MLLCRAVTFAARQKQRRQQPGGLRPLWQPGRRTPLPRLPALQPLKVGTATSGSAAAWLPRREEALPSCLGVSSILLALLLQQGTLRGGPPGGLILPPQPLPLRSLPRSTLLHAHGQSQEGCAEQ